MNIAYGNRLYSKKGIDMMPYGIYKDSINT